MPLTTTCIGAYPKPEGLPVQDWFQVDGSLSNNAGAVTRAYTSFLQNADESVEAQLCDATRSAVTDQVVCGIDIPTDGEQRRENYIHYHARHLDGFDFINLTRRTLRDGAYSAELPTITGKVMPRGEHFLDADFAIAQSFTDRPVKITVPGPLTMMDTTANTFYDDERELAFDLARAINYEIRALAEAGCRYIQVDEPLFARNVTRALDFGVECLDRCFDGVPDTVTRVMHMCCGYPEHLDDQDYHKADPASYFALAQAIDGSTVNQISIEDAHRHNRLELLEKFQRSTIILGAVAIADSRLETVAEIAGRLTSALNHIDASRLIAAPDCGLAMLGRDLAMKKLRNLCTAAASI